MYKVKHLQGALGDSCKPTSQIYTTLCEFYKIKMKNKNLIYIQGLTWKLCETHYYHINVLGQKFVLIILILKKWHNGAIFLAFFCCIFLFVFNWNQCGNKKFPGTTRINANYTEILLNTRTTFNYFCFECECGASEWREPT